MKQTKSLNLVSNWSEITFIVLSKWIYTKYTWNNWGAIRSQMQLERTHSSSRCHGRWGWLVWCGLPARPPWCHRGQCGHAAPGRSSRWSGERSGTGVGCSSVRYRPCCRWAAGWWKNRKHYILEYKLHFSTLMALKSAKVARISQIRKPLVDGEDINEINWWIWDSKQTFAIIYIL